MFLILFSSVYLGFVVSADGPVDLWRRGINGLFFGLFLLSIPGWIYAWKLNSPVKKRDALHYVFYLAFMILWFPFGGPLAITIWGSELKKEDGS
ncbi:MAG TPA: hypothetical protein VGE22_06705 [Solimonas sp.]